MDWSRGLFRLWLVTSLAWVALVTAISWSDLADEFSRSKDEAAYNAIATPLVPIDCKVAKGVQGTDYKKEDEGPWLEYQRDPTLRRCWYELPKFRQIFPEYADLNDDDLAHRLYAAVDKELKPTPHPWRHLANVAALALGVPILLLVIGLVLRWVGQGFQSTRA